MNGALAALAALAVAATRFSAFGITSTFWANLAGIAASGEIWPLEAGNIKDLGVNRRPGSRSSNAGSPHRG